MLRARIRWPRPRRGGPVVRLLRWWWSAPTNLVGHIAGILVSGGMGRRIGGQAAVGWLYEIRPRLGLDWVGAVTLGHAILHRRGMFEGGLRGRLVLAHELAHTRQHDWLGPAYLPLHALAQIASALLSLGRTVVVSRVHDRNPLEQTFTCLGASATHLPVAADFDAERFLAEFGV